MLKKSFLFSSLALLSCTTQVFADSAKIFDSANGHYYQRFDVAQITFDRARSNCQNLNGHLVTLDSSEWDFVYTGLISYMAGFQYYYIGGYYDGSSWRWVTGKPFNLNITAPDDPIYKYLAMLVGERFVYTIGDSTSSLFFNKISGYVCEWDGNNFVDNATLPDLNINGVPEIASLYLDNSNNKHTVVIRDPKSKVVINTLTFDTSAKAPIGLAVVADMNNNGIPEIAVLSSDLTVQIKDAQNNATVLKKISFLNSSYQPRAITVMPDTNNNGYDELTVLGVNGSDVVSETKDSKTGKLLFRDSL